MSQEMLSASSIKAASKSKAKKSSHGGAGAAGHVQDGMDTELNAIMGKSTQQIIPIDVVHGSTIEIGLSWNNTVTIREEGLLNKIFKKMRQEGVDLDLGCLYELNGDRRGCLQAFGELFGAFGEPPYIHHGGDERTGDTEGFDEVMRVNGARWSEINRILVYCYIYKGPHMWEDIYPEVTLSVPGVQDTKFHLSAYRDDLPVCALATLENVDGNIRLSPHAEYFHDHASMDRAFGYGLRWEDGKKN
ncbi:MAG: Tellurium resistance protein TerA [Micavibrio sp.]|nr:Tellurium resistance protein TerA [Micavibrio sp.]|tara:strand:- start:1326 stop:2063 length:738 start_codon:yes stop_codon:yes gene_type:complete